MIKSLFLLVLTLVFLSGCSIFGSSKEIKKLPSNGLSPKALYEIAQSKLEDGSIEKAIEQFEIILASYPRSKYAVQAQLDIAYNLFKQKKFNRSISKLDQFIEKYPNLPSTPYAYYLRGVIAEEKSSSILDKLITDSAQRDVESVRNAYGYYLILIELFPNSKYSQDAIKKLDSLKNTLARHEFYVALYYTEIESHIAAINRSKFIIENYPNSSSIPDSLDLMAYNYDQINATKLASDIRIVLSSSYPDYSKNYSID
jgi:outer membrane protein assembly factor BamD